MGLHKHEQKIADQLNFIKSLKFLLFGLLFYISYYIKHILKSTILYLMYTENVQNLIMIEFNILSFYMV